ncbi:hypothetical protein DMB42_39510 [Nonomuraea sp. WAC 01424]|uniref:hypothetical protein n=1 Tax=Nonomuraea sp. WAC 01424 TaxID=2203200 RepID=UPI000F7A67CF|nr:hypothetical protein [Nonomuraea sp. WAC 01424]RSN01089.1 hypothetical protein DMB42_39510 [Nonomuraea sp. WAC 01424]
MATLTAAVTWPVAGPSTADTCRAQNESVASYCNGKTMLRLNEGKTNGHRVVTEEISKLAVAAGDMARRLGLTGLTTARSAMGPLADLGGVGATWGMPSLTSASPALFPMVPGDRGMRDLATTLQVPALPALPALPQTPIMARVPAETAVGGKPTSPAKGQSAQAPMDLRQPVHELGGRLLANLLPKAVQSVEGASTLPGGPQAVDGFSRLLPGLGLG